MSKPMSKWKTYVVYMMMAGFFILLHQWVEFGVLFEVSDLHHETFAISFFFGALVVYRYSRRKTHGGGT